MAKRQTRTELWLQGDGGPRTVPAGTTNEWGGNLRSEGRPVLLRRDPLGLVEGYSTTSSTIVPLKGGGYAVVPTVVDGKDIGEAGAYRHFRETGEYWGRADTISGAEDIADSVHERHAELNFDEWNAFASSSLSALSPELREGISRAMRDERRGVGYEEKPDAGVPATQMDAYGGSTRRRTGAIGGRANVRPRLTASMRANSARFAAGWYQDAQGNWVDPSKPRAPMRAIYPARRSGSAKPADPIDAMVAKDYGVDAPAAQTPEKPLDWKAALAKRYGDDTLEERLASMGYVRPPAAGAEFKEAKPASVLASAGMTKREQQEYRERMRADRRQAIRAELDKRVSDNLSSKAEARKTELAQLAASNAEARARSRAELDRKYGHAQFPTGSGRTPTVDSATFTRKLELAKLMAERYRGTDKYQAYMDRIAKLEASGLVDKDLQAKIRRDQDYANREAMGNYGRTVYEVNTDNGRLAGTGNDPYGTGLGAAVKKSADRRVTVGTLPGSNLQDVIRPGQTPAGLPSVGEMAQRSMRTGAQGAWDTMLQRYQADAAARRAHKLVGQYTGGEVTYGYDAKRGRRVKDLDEETPSPTGAAAFAGRTKRSSRASLLGGSVATGPRTTSGPRTSGIGIRSFAPDLGSSSSPFYPGLTMPSPFRGSTWVWTRANGMTGSFDRDDWKWRTSY